MRDNDGNGRASARAALDTPGVADFRRLPDDEFLELWNAIVVPKDVKDRLLGQALLSFTLRPKARRARLPLHGLILLVGPPGTGKTSLARGLAACVAESVPDPSFRFLEVEPHGLASSALGKSQKAVTDLLGSTIAEQANVGPLVVLLDEVETLAADRTRMSLEANPIDVHRATDAVLAQLDRLAANHPGLLFLATSNFSAAIDSAFVSRADLVVDIGLPSPEACRTILADTVESLADLFPPVRRILTTAGFDEAAASCHGLDARQIRKAVITACALDKETALHPDRLTVAQLGRAIDLARAEAKRRGR